MATPPFMRKGIKATGYMTNNNDKIVLFANKIIKCLESGNTKISCAVINGQEVEGQFAPMNSMFSLQESYTVQEQTFNTIQDVVIPVPNNNSQVI